MAEGGSKADSGSLESIAAPTIEKRISVVRAADLALGPIGL
jgi:hypothetical protein